MTTKVNLNTTVGGVQFAQLRNVSSEASLVQERTVPAAQSGTLTTRSSNTAGTITMASGSHTVTTGARVDLYWTGGCRRGVTVGTVSTTSVPVSGGSGDNLPTQGDPIKVSIPVSFSTPLTGNKVKALLLGAPEARSQFVLCSSGNTEELAKTVPQGGVFAWDSGSLETNPIAGDTIVNTFISHDDTSGAKKVQFAAPFDN